MPNDRSKLLLALAFGLALLVLAQGISAPFVKDAEPQSAQWIASVVQGNWLLSRDYYGFLNPKPPLFYWLSAVVTELTGGTVDEVRARAVSLVAAAATATALLGWTTAMLGAEVGALAFLFLLGSYAFASRATTALTDMLMTLLLFAAYLVIYPGLDRRLSPRRIGAAGLLLGLAVLTKGPVAPALIGLALALYLLLEGRNPLLLFRRGWLWIIFAVAGGIGAVWYIPAFAHGEHRAVGIFASENFGHFMPAALGGTGEAARPIYYILLRMLGGFLPLTPLLLAAPWMVRDAGSSPAIRRPLHYQLAMVLAVLLLFSAASAKRDDYILPAFPSLAFLLAALFLDAWRRVAQVRNLISGLIGLGAMLAVLGGLALWFEPALSSRIAPNLQSSDASYLAIVIAGVTHQRRSFELVEIAYAVGAALTLIGIERGITILSGAGLATITLAGTLLWTAVIRPEEARTHTVAEFARDVRERLGPAAPLYTTAFDPELSWYYGREVRPLPREMWRGGNHGSAPVYLIARSDDLVRLSPAVRDELHPLMQSSVLGRGGPPILFELAPQSKVGERLQR